MGEESRADGENDGTTDGLDLTETKGAFREDFSGARGESIGESDGDLALSSKEDAWSRASDCWLELSESLDILGLDGLEKLESLPPDSDVGVTELHESEGSLLSERERRWFRSEDGCDDDGEEGATNAELISFGASLLKNRVEESCSLAVEGEKRRECFPEKRRGEKATISSKFVALEVKMSVDLLPNLPGVIHRRSEEPSNPTENDVELESSSVPVPVRGLIEEDRSLL